MTHVYRFALAAVASFTSSVWASQTAVCGFEAPAYHVGTLDGQGGWVVLQTGSLPSVARVVTAPRHEGAQAALFDQIDMNTGDAAVWNCNVTFAASESIVDAQWDFYQIPGDGYGWFVALHAPNGLKLGELWIDGGNIWYRVGGMRDPLGTSGFLDPNTWGRFKVTLDWSTRTTEFFLNGSSIAMGAWGTNVPRTVSTFSIGAVVAPASDTAGLDAMSVTARGSCAADYNADGFVTGDDFDSYVADFELGSPLADFDHDGFVTGDDFDAFVAAFEAGC